MTENKCILAQKKRCQKPRILLDVSRQHFEGVYWYSLALGPVLGFGGALDASIWRALRTQLSLAGILEPCELASLISAKSEEIAPVAYRQHTSQFGLNAALTLEFGENLGTRIGGAERMEHDLAELARICRKRAQVAPAPKVAAALLRLAKHYQRRAALLHGGKQPPQRWRSRITATPPARPQTGSQQG